MTPEEINRAVNEEMGWKPETRKFYAGKRNVKGWGFNTHLTLGSPHRFFTINGEHFTNYFADLNACREMEETLTTGEACIYWSTIHSIAGDEANTGHWRDLYATGHASAHQRCEAFLRVKGKWVE